MSLLSLVMSQGAKKIVLTACHSGKLKLAFTSPDVISTSPKTFLTSRIDFSSSYSNSSKKITCPLGKLKTEFTSPIAKSTSPSLSDTTFFARCVISCRGQLCHLTCAGWRDFSNHTRMSTIQSRGWQKRVKTMQLWPQNSHENLVLLPTYLSIHLILRS